ALARLPGELEALWRRPDLTAAERRATLFQLWDDLLEGPGASGEEEEAQAARRARTELLRFIRRALPASSPEAFTSAELARLNARRRSRESFDPYRAPP